MRRLARKGVVFRAGDEGAVLYRLRAGLVRMVEILPDGRLIAVRHVLPGDFFGEEALEGRPYRYTAEAMTEAAVEGHFPEGMGLDGWQQVARSLAEQMAR
ncbi:cyclic nucleotide-binding domain-containing protein, partial [Thermus sp.]